MENGKSPKGLTAFFAGKGFYIVLSLCAVIIGVTVWAMLTRAETKTEAETDYSDWVDLDAYGAAEYTTEIPITPQAPETTDVGLNFTEPEDAQAVSAPENEPEAAAVWNVDEGASSIVQRFYWPVNGEIARSYSMDTLLYNPTLSDWRTHDGMDIEAPLGTQVMASGAGRVESIYTDDLLGVTVIIDHTGGLKSVYCNLADSPTVSVGQNVEAGEIIGSVGATALGETAQATHLHFAMTLDGQALDPENYMP